MNHPTSAVSQGEWFAHKTFFTPYFKCPLKRNHLKENQGTVKASELKALTPLIQ